jgi:hypothetical protein
MYYFLFLGRAARHVYQLIFCYCHNHEWNSTQEPSHLNANMGFLLHILKLQFDVADWRHTVHV